jgi:hypothetical protein
MLNLRQITGFLINDSIRYTFKACLRNITSHCLWVSGGAGVFYGSLFGSD